MRRSSVSRRSTRQWRTARTSKKSSCRDPPMFLKLFWKLLATSLVLSAATAVPAVEVLAPAGGLPPTIVGQMRGPAAFVQTSDGKYIVFDLRGHQVYGVDAAKKVLK